MLFGDLQAKDAKEPLKHRLGHRFELMRERQWSRLWELSSAERLPMQQRQAGSQRAQAEKAAKKIQLLLAKREMSRALAAVWVDSSTMGGAVDTKEAFREQFPEQNLPDIPQPTESGVAQDLYARLEADLGDRWGTYPRLSGAGPLGDRMEHLGVLSGYPDAARKVAQVGVRLAKGQVPAGINDLVLATRVAAIPQKTSKTRLIGCGATLRRFVGSRRRE